MLFWTQFGRSKIDLDFNINDKEFVWEVTTLKDLKMNE